MNRKQRLLALLVLRRKIRNRRKRRHRFWSKEIFMKRSTLGEFNLFQEMYQKDQESFRSCFRMSPTQFDYVMSRVGPRIEKCSYRCRPPIDARQRLAVTLRYAYLTIPVSYKLQNYVIRGIAYNWFKSYLCSRCSTLLLTMFLLVLLMSHVECFRDLHWDHFYFCCM